MSTHLLKLIHFFDNRVMMSSMILFILWMCYCCRWKDNKFDTTACADQPQPFWIDVNSNAYYEALQWSLQQVITVHCVCIDINV